MIGLLLIYFIVKPFYALAQLHDKNKWLFSGLALVIFYAGTTLGGGLLGIAIALLGTANSIEKMTTASDNVLGLMCLPFGLLAIWGAHTLLKKRLENTQNAANPHILDENL
jgi:hypothetical protein